MGKDRLNSLVVLNIHSGICNTVMEEDIEKLVNKFNGGGKGEGLIHLLVSDGQSYSDGQELKKIQ